MAEKILIVDDDVDSLKLIGLMLKRNGYEVVAADSGGKALAKAEEESPDLIILDVMMPDMNGLEVCRRLRNNDNTVGIPIIMFTAKTLIDDKVKGFEAGADDYLTKPTHPAELASRVRAILARKQSQPAGEQASGAGGSAIAPIKNAATPAPAKPGMAIGILGAKGGVGTTTVAINLAAAMQRSGESSVVADFRPGLGTLGLMLGAQSQGLARVVGQNNLNPAGIDTELVTHQSGLKALLASTNPREVNMPFPPEKAASLVKILRTKGHPAIIDMGAGLSQLNMRVAADVEKVVYVVESNPMTLQLAKAQLRELDDQFGGARTSVVVVNRVQSSLPWHEVENALGREVKAIISPAPELAYQSIVNRTPMVALQPNHVVSGQFIKLADELKARWQG